MLAGAFPARRWRGGNRVQRQHWLRWHPEWWALLLCVLAWGWLLLAMRQTAPDWTGMMCSANATFGQWRWSVTAHQFVHWLVMTAAMMLPLLIMPIRHVAFRSLWQRRQRAIAAFLGGYLLVWLLAGFVLSVLLALDNVSDIGRPDARLPLLLFGVAAGWQIAPARLRALRICHRTVPLAPTGWQADMACLRYGWFIGRHCLQACWAMMLAAAFAPAHLLAMAGVSAICVAERYQPRLSARITAGLLLALGGLLALWQVR
ncbi:DUF2182 domain-containing protein [Silvimonas soli]|uniref:copper chaperone n=1 Tax=Silvimonas soli TaxID=2980100 RepID=UPI0024B3BF7A|nr:DUF2182 domain-containing protein [Silvimonas soli]